MPYLGPHPTPTESSCLVLGLLTCWRLGAVVVDGDLKVIASIMECCPDPQHLFTCWAYCLTLCWGVGWRGSMTCEMCSLPSESSVWKPWRRKFLTLVKMYSRESFCLSVSSTMRNQTMYLKKRGKKHMGCSLLRSSGAELKLFRECVASVPC